MPALIDGSDWRATEAGTFEAPPACQGRDFDGRFQLLGDVQSPVQRSNVSLVEVNGEVIGRDRAERPIPSGEIGLSGESSRQLCWVNGSTENFPCHPFNQLLEPPFEVSYEVHGSESTQYSILSTNYSVLSTCGSLPVFDRAVGVEGKSSFCLGMHGV